MIRGRLSPRYDAAFDGVTLLPGRADTLLTAELADPSQLYGLLNRLRDLGIELVSVNRPEPTVRLSATAEQVAADEADVAALRAGDERRSGGCLTSTTRDEAGRRTAT